MVSHTPMRKLRYYAPTMTTPWLQDGPADAARRYLFAHGAGSPMDHPFMDRVARGLAAEGIGVTRFEFPYMARRREDGKRRAPDRGPKLQMWFREQVAALAHVPTLVIGGKSLGGRIASAIVDDVGAAGLLCLGFPFHPTGKPENRDRVARLKTVQTSTLIIQGSRDSFGNREQVRGYRLPEHIQVHWLEDGNHSFEPRKRSGLTLDEHLDTAVARMIEFIQGL